MDISEDDTSNVDIISNSTARPRRKTVQNTIYLPVGGSISNRGNRPVRKRYNNKSPAKPRKKKGSKNIRDKNFYNYTSMLFNTTDILNTNYAEAIIQIKLYDEKVTYDSPTKTATSQEQLDDLCADVCSIAACSMNDLD